MPTNGERGPSPHDVRVAFLEALAGLVGCTDRVGGCLPDGRRPDVLALDRERGTLFIGEGKDTETPGCHATQERLLRYLEWLAVYVSHGARGVCAICFGRAKDAHRWLDVSTELGRRSGVAFEHQAVKCFDDELWVAYSVASYRTTTQPRVG